MMRVPSVLSAAVLLLAAALPSVAQPLVIDESGFSPTDRAVFFFGGRFHSEYFGGSFQVFNAPYEDNYLLGGGYQHVFNRNGDFSLGGEAGASIRFGEGEPTSFEAWGGVYGRYDGFVLGPVRISPSLTFGLSAVTDTIGVETERASWIGGAPAVLYYLAPEISLSMVDRPDLEVFWRVQHRSGGFGTIAHIDGSNANTVGLRWKF